MALFEKIHASQMSKCRQMELVLTNEDGEDWAVSFSIGIEAFIGLKPLVPAMIERETATLKYYVVSGLKSDSLK
jgi:hypothetical protein